MHKATLEHVHVKATVAVAAGKALERLWLTDKILLGADRPPRNCSMWVSPTQNKGKGRCLLEC